jgi:hypothetical protein
MCVCGLHDAPAFVAAARVLLLQDHLSPDCTAGYDGHVLCSRWHIHMYFCARLKTSRGFRPDVVLGVGCHL